MENNERPIINFKDDQQTATDPISSDAKAFKEIVERMSDIFIKKNHDYGNSFAESVRELGPIAGFTLIMHKFNRLKNLIKGNNAMVKEESVEDTLLDMANYCIMLKMELDKLKIR